VFTFLFFLALGVGAGVYWGWVRSPIQYVNTEPASLRQDYKDDYVLMIATLYSADHDAEAAQFRLVQLKLGAPGPVVAAATERFILRGQPAEDLRRLVSLAIAFQTVTPAMQPYIP
jgi:hypothetical protein